jgi:hypothetical protein
MKTKMREREREREILFFLNERTTFFLIGGEKNETGFEKMRAQSREQGIYKNKCR